MITPPGEWHWHGAAGAGMTVIAIQGADGDGAVARWVEPVSEPEYHS